METLSIKFLEKILKKSLENVSNVHFSKLVKDIWRNILSREFTINSWGNVSKNVSPMVLPWKSLWEFSKNSRKIWTHITQQIPVEILVRIPLEIFESLDELQNSGKLI